MEKRHVAIILDGDGCRAVRYQNDEAPADIIGRALIIITELIDPTNHQSRLEADKRSRHWAERYGPCIIYSKPCLQESS